MTERPIQLLHNGNQVFSAMLEAIDRAEKSIRLEMYIFLPSPIADLFRSGLVAAQKRGVEVGVLVDAWGSIGLPDAYFAELLKAGGKWRRFNPIRLNRCFFRNHRKLLVVDERLGFVGGCNISQEYVGDGIESGWFDLGLRVEQLFCTDLAASFDRNFQQADFVHRLVRLKRNRLNQRLQTPEGDLIFIGPGLARGLFRKALKEDLKRASQVQIVAAYFLPSWRMRSDLMRVARRGGRVQLLLAGRSDVPITQFASRSLYSRLMRAGVEIYEYQPQVLHAKMLILDQVVYMGSANLDTRSLRINYELMLRLPTAGLAKETREVFTQLLTHSTRVEPTQWRGSRSFWSKLKERWSYFILARVDPYIAQRQLRSLR